MLVTRSVTCPLPGFEGCEVTYNLMATETELDAFYAKMGGEETAMPIVAEIQGWPLQGVDPWGKEVPLAWRFWVARTGFAQAVASWLKDPDFTTTSTHGLRAGIGENGTVRPTGIWTPY